jgi:hypothetical protein
MSTLSRDAHKLLAFVLSPITGIRRVISNLGGYLDSKRSADARAGQNKDSLESK